MPHGSGDFHFHTVRVQQPVRLILKHRLYGYFPSRAGPCGQAGVYSRALESTHIQGPHTRFAQRYQLISVKFSDRKTNRERPWSRVQREQRTKQKTSGVILEATTGRRAPLPLCQGPADQHATRTASKVLCQWLFRSPTRGKNSHRQ